MKNHVRLVPFLLLFASCASTAPAADRLDELCSWMCGSFSSAAQAAVDPEFRDIRLHMTRIWPERGDGRWLYVEQATAEREDRPYRQRVYRLVADDEGWVSEVYELPGDPLAFSGAWRDPARIAALDPAQLVPRTGCSIRLQWRGDGTYAGSTGVGTCPSALNGASYATSEVVITAATLTSWDRGYDAAGSQVWGAVQGPYVFVRQ
jgi:hypothetical protein